MQRHGLSQKPDDFDTPVEQCSRSDDTDSNGRLLINRSKHHIQPQRERSSDASHRAPQQNDRRVEVPRPDAEVDRDDPGIHQAEGG